MGPKMAQDGPKTAQDGRRWAQDRRRWVKIAKDGVKIVLRSSKTRKWCKTHSKKHILKSSGPQDGPKMAPRWPPDGPKMAQDRPRCAPRWPKTAPKPPKMAEDGSRSRRIVLRSCSDRRRCENAIKTKGKTTFLIKMRPTSTLRGRRSDDRPRRGWSPAENF